MQSLVAFYRLYDDLMSKEVRHAEPDFHIIYKNNIKTIYDSYYCLSLLYESPRR